MALVTQAEFARLQGVNRSTVSRWVKAERITADSAGMIDPEAAARMRIATESPMPHHQARKAQFDEAKESADAIDAEALAAGTEGDDALDGTESIGTALKRATLDLQRSKAAMAALELDQLAGRLVDRSDIDFVLADLGTTLRGLLEGLADRLAGEIAAHQGNVPAIHKSLEDASREILLAVSGQMQQRMEALAP